jgi:hypothetical protein
MVLSNKIFNNIDLEMSDSEEDEDIITDEIEIQQLEKKLIENYILLQKNKKDIKKKEKNNYLLNSLVIHYDEIDKNIKKELNHLINHLQLLDDYIEKNKKKNKKMIEQKNIKIELNKIKYLYNI